ncbi:MAG: hypothetical protein AW10_03102 [Candidatus Accumulibacter appositus]|uniref:Uncharacterized protein n=1 Tax=Candidatus Accumulibacter appositus TaxID=1454003 RepID=A0A011PMR6_9PROT|nr:MAG: hypothetical protein AW10_03102 [Candidatus Accumulibacter appositus]
MDRVEPCRIALWLPAAGSDLLSFGDRGQGAATLAPASRAGGPRAPAVIRGGEVGRARWLARTGHRGASIRNRMEPRWSSHGEHGQRRAWSRIRRHCRDGHGQLCFSRLRSARDRRQSAAASAASAKLGQGDRSACQACGQSQGHYRRRFPSGRDHRSSLQHANMARINPGELGGLPTACHRSQQGRLQRLPARHLRSTRRVDSRPGRDHSQRSPGRERPDAHPGSHCNGRRAAQNRAAPAKQDVGKPAPGGIQAS